jgi:hypothetical protein
MQTAIRPEVGSTLRVTRVCLRADAPYGTRVEDTPWGTLVGLATGSESGWDCGARTLGSPALSLMFDLLRGPDPVAALPGAFAAGSQCFAADPSFAENDEPDLPILTVVLALCEPRRITLAWVGNDKAYLLRDGRVAAQSEEHTRRMLLRGPLARPLTPTEAAPDEHDIAWRALPAEQRLLGPIRRLFADLPTLVLSRDVRGPPAMMHLERRPGDMLLLLAGGLHKRLEWDAGLTAALAPGPLTIDRLVTEIDRRDPRRTGELAGGSDPYGPILLAEL